MTEIIRTDKFSIRENKGRYYVYYIDHLKPKLRYLYVGPLDKIIETYIAVGGCAPTVRVRGFEPRMAFASGS
ncbi:putative integrase [Acidianus ambivalens]|uniref:ORF D-335-like domain-containing protein n=1 Tax=Acidianus ambivalens TaxID=2283 RepID=A0A650CYA8_ACIAM|nr:putative integrase [Acidianus ambivalens]MQL55418.1 hypothetical protein [Acidianus ambivalens]QGR22823.1 hypothetical protein D1866_02095 [Acidianus ambivalens]